MRRFLLEARSGSGRVFQGYGGYKHDLGNVKGIRDLTATWEAGFTKIWARIRDWERKQCSDRDDRSSRKKEAGMCAGSGPPVSRHFLY